MDIPICITDYDSHHTFKTTSYYTTIINERIEPHKIYFVIKSNFCVKNISGHNSSLILKDYLPTYSATVYELLIKAGHLCKGVAVNDSFCMGVGQNSICTQTSEGYPVGGSSSGPAYLVANEPSIHYGIGSDTAGSITMPAVQNRLYGFHPSRGKISRWGMHEYCPQLDRVGIFTKSIEMLKEITDILLVYDNKDNLMVNPLDVNKSIHNLDIYAEENISEYLNITFKIEKIDWKQVEKFYQNKIQPYAYSSLQRYDGVRFNNRWSAAMSENEKTISRNNLLTKTVKHRIRFGYLQTENYELEQSLMSHLSNSIVILKHSVKKSLKELHTFEARYALANVLNCASIVLPVNKDVSLEIIAPAGCEKSMFELIKYVR
jgi:Asp-tRNA(Asn)/Glu-tRNA(Gln) amidotransferase A subunit family amidase